MMRSIYRAAVAVACTALLATTIAVHAESPASVRKTLQSYYTSADAAAARKDVKGLFAHNATDFTNVDAAGKKTNLAEEKASFEQVLPVARSISSHTKIVKLTVKRNTAIATTSANMTMHLLNPQTHAVSVMTAQGSSVDTWSRRGGHWVLTHSKGLHDVMKVDGKTFRIDDRPVQPGAAQP